MLDHIRRRKKIAVRARNERRKGWEYSIDLILWVSWYKKLTHNKFPKKKYPKTSQSFHLFLTYWDCFLPLFDLHDVPGPLFAFNLRMRENRC